MIGVYGIKNQLNGKIYIGSSVNVKKRWRNHKYNLRKGQHHAPHLQNAWNLDGENAFEFILLEELTSSDFISEREQFWMDYHMVADPQYGYNIAIFAEHPKLGWITPEEVKRKISESLKDRHHIHNDETKRLISNTMKANQQHKGSSNPAAKLTEDKVKEIKSMIASGSSNAQVASVFCVSRATIAHIRTGRKWADIN